MEDPCSSTGKRKSLDLRQGGQVEEDDEQQPSPSAQPPVKRRRIGDSPADEHPSSDISSIESAHSSPKSSPEEPPPSNLLKDSNKVIWVDIGADPEETYWWPGLIYENNLKSYVTLMPNSKSKLVDITPKLLDSLKATKPFKAHSVFDPVQLNPIFKQKEPASKYPTKKSLEKAYVIAREKHVIYSFEEDDDLPDVSACMIPLSQESRAVLAHVLSPEDKSSEISEVDVDDLDEMLDGPDQELDIPGETVVCRMNARSQEYWPARVISYMGLKSNKRGPPKLSKKPAKSEKTYRIQFCDGSQIVAPRSSFWTIDQEEFYRVKIGQVKTREVKFEEMIPQIDNQLHELDLIINGKSKDPNLIIKHEDFLTSLKNRGSIPRDVKYGKYSEELIHRVGNYLRDRYLVNQLESEEAAKITVDSRFERLSETEKSQYIFDILVPELIWLITVAQYLEDGRDKLIAESGLTWEELEKDASKQITTEKILEEAKKLAALDIHEVDLVDKVISLRVQREKNLQTAASSSSSPSAKPADGLHHISSSSSKSSLPSCNKISTSTKLRQTYNSRKY